ncbi:ArgS-related anticodon-binding protein NrtL [Streptomyces halobius]|uniref:arginine--tRNA ligase n=1 Tax=Streptomyces halobius TaxID=2879846 RepID=A0ABY4M5P0_9ACTN|nr:DALR anticodon-binding domain-containing protein [Streptomyces halobius]UQA93095.1 hypothetical protein K9S39_15705 [Streptomyces halobius]
MTPAELSRTVLRSVRGAVAERELSVPVPARIVVQPPPRAGCGDYASNVALQLAGPAGRPAREVAEILRKRLAGSAGIARVEIAGPGFLNFTLGDGARAALVREVLAQGSAYGGRPGYGSRSEHGSGSAHGSQGDEGDEKDERAPLDGGRLPDGELLPPGLSGARAVVVADALGRLLVAAGMGQRARTHAPAAPAGEGELGELVARLGGDEARWALLRPAAHDPVRLPERPVQRESNPRFRVQYTYARTRALTRNARDLGFGSEPGDTSPTEDEPERSLHTLLATFPRTVEAAARYRAPDRMVRHLEATADAFLRWQDGCPPLPVGERKPLAVHRARLALAEATGTVLANGLCLLGISAPAHL